MKIGTFTILINDLYDLNNSLNAIGTYIDFTSNVQLSMPTGNGYFGEVFISNMENYDENKWLNKIGVDFIDCICITNFRSVAKCTVVNNNAIYINGDLQAIYQIKIRVYLSKE